MSLAKEKYILTQEIPDAFPTGMAIWSELGGCSPAGGSSIRKWFMAKPLLTMPPIPENRKGEATGNTFADAKGLVLYAQASKEAQEAVWEFIRWVFSKPEHDLLWMETTSLPPERDDLAENPVFADYLAQAPALVPYAESLASAVPATSHTASLPISKLRG